MQQQPTNEQRSQLENRWRVRSRRDNFVWEGSLVAVWEVEGDPISDNYTVDEIAAAELLSRWAAGLTKKHPNGLIPIHWFISSKDAAKFEGMPFQYDHFSGRYAAEDFLTFFEWPEHVTTGEPINWLTVPVIDKLWNSRVANKGGFIQEVTGWKPSVLQPFVFLPALLKASVH